jgi:hypothetical protein
MLPQIEISIGCTQWRTKLLPSDVTEEQTLGETWPQPEMHGKCTKRVRSNDRFYSLKNKQNTGWSQEKYCATVRGIKRTRRSVGQLLYQLHITK